MNDSINQESRVLYYGWTVAGMALLANLFAYGLVYAFSVFFKTLSHEFGWSRSAIAGAFTAYAIIHNVFAIPAGRITDRFGPRPVLIVSGFCLGLSMVLMSRISTIWELYLYYGVFLSLGVGGIYTPMMATVSKWFIKKRGMAIGIATAGLGMGSLVISPLTAWLIASFGWRMTYVVLGIISWLFFIPIIKFTKPFPLENKIENHHEDSSRDFTFLEAFMTRNFWAFSFSLLFIALAVWAIIVHLIPMLTDKGMSLVAAGRTAGLLGAGGLLGRIFSGYLSDRIKRQHALLIAFFLQLILLIWLLISHESWMFFCFAFFFGISYGGWSGVIGAFPADYFGIKANGAILGFSVSMAGIGVAIGPYLGGYIFDRTNSYHYMLLVCIFSTIIAIIFALGLGSPSRKGRQK